MEASDDALLNSLGTRSLSGSGVGRRLAVFDGVAVVVPAAVAVDVAAARRGGV